LGALRGKGWLPSADHHPQNLVILDPTPQKIVFFSVRELTPALRFFSVARERTHLLNEIGRVDRSGSPTSIPVEEVVYAAGREN
jgi:hypothetical protein